MLLITAIKISANHDMASVQCAMMNKTASSLKKIVSAVKAIGNVNIENVNLFSHGKKTAAANDIEFLSRHESHSGVITVKEKDNANEPTGGCYPEKLNPFFDETLTHTAMNPASAKRQESYPEKLNPFSELILPRTEMNPASANWQESQTEKLNSLSNATLPRTETGHAYVSRHESHPEQKIVLQANCGVTPISPNRDQHLIEPENTALAGIPFLAANQNQAAKVMHSVEAENTRHSVVPPASLSDTPLHINGNIKSKDGKGGIKGMCKSLALKLKKAGGRKVTASQININESEKRSPDTVYIPDLACSTKQVKSLYPFPAVDNYDHAKSADRRKLYEILQRSDPGNDIINFIDESMVARYFIGKGLENVKGLVNLTNTKAFSLKKAFQNRPSKLTRDDLIAVMKEFNMQNKEKFNKVYDNLTCNIHKSKESEDKPLGAIYGKLKRSLYLVGEKIAKKRGKAAVARFKNNIEYSAVDIAIKSKIKTKIHEAFSGEIIISACKNDTYLADCLIKSFHSFCIKETARRLKGAELNAEASVIRQFFETVYRSHRELVEHQEKALAAISDKNGSSYPNVELKNVQNRNSNRYLSEVKDSILKIALESSQDLDQELYRIERDPGRLKACKRWLMGSKPRHERINNAERAYAEKYKAVQYAIKSFPQNSTENMQLHHELNTVWKEIITPEQVANNVDKKMNSMESRWRRFVTGLKSSASMGVATACLVLVGLSVFNTITLPVSAVIISVYLIMKWKEAHDDYKFMQARRNESRNTHSNGSVQNSVSR